MPVPAVSVSAAKASSNGRFGQCIERRPLKNRENGKTRHGGGNGRAPITVNQVC
jgi:hypothetical protein